MLHFTYTARRPSGERIAGLIEALSLQEARTALQMQGLSVEEIHEATQRDKTSVSGNGDTPPGVASPQKPALPNVSASTAQRSYAPLLSTLRLYAGWLLLWYGVCYALGAYQLQRGLPTNIPVVEALLPPYANAVFIAVTACFLFLAATSVAQKLQLRTLGTVACLLLVVAATTAIGFLS